MINRRRFCLGMGTQLALAHSCRTWAGTAPADPVSEPVPVKQSGRDIRIACTDWAAAESLALLGNMPIAVPELSVYRQWLPNPILPANTADLGARTEPNLEALSTLAPDCIFISSWQAGMLMQFRRIAWTEIVRLFRAQGDPYQGMRDLLLQVGRASGCNAKARECLDDFDSQISQLREFLGTGRRRSLYVAVLHENGAQAYVYGRGSWVDTVIGKLGLQNAWEAPTTFYGNSLVGIASLAGNPDAAILYLDQGARTRRALAQLRDSTLWNGLPAMATGRAIMIPSFFALGGIPSATRCAHLIANAMMDEPAGSATAISDIVNTGRTGLLDNLADTS